MIEPRQHIGAMASYELADLEIATGKKLISMAQNESLRPPSPYVVDAIKRVLPQTHLYPDPQWQQVREAISSVHGIAPEYILCGAGSMELIACLAQTYLDSGSSVVTSQYAYAFFATAARLNNAEVISAPEPSYTVSIDEILNRCEHNTRMVFLANPGNPTGTRISGTEIRRLRNELSRDVLLVIDEAYGEFADTDGETLFDLCQHGNTVIIRTFSKAYGLAGMRVGWGVFPSDIANQVRKVLNPNNISISAQAAAEAAMLDQKYMRKTCEITKELREKLRRKLNNINERMPPSHTNFLLLPFENPQQADGLNKYLLSKGIAMRPMAGYGLPNCLRATIVDKSELEIVFMELAKWGNVG